MNITLEGKDLEAARIGIELTIVAQATGGIWGPLDDDPAYPVEDHDFVLDDRSRCLDLIAAVGRIGDGRTSVALDAGPARRLALELRDVGHDLVPRMRAGDDCAADDYLAIYTLVKALDVALA